MDEQRARTLSSMLDEIVPASPDGTLPAAGALGLASHFAALLARTPELELTIAPGLAAADALATGRHGRPFAALSRQEKTDVLGALDAAQPGFLPTLVFHTYVGYYQHPRVLAALGLEARPPHPGGYAMAPNDPTLLDPVRRRPPLYRRG
jgi:hypothetical protein